MQSHLSNNFTFHIFKKIDERCLTLEVRGRGFCTSRKFFGQHACGHARAQQQNHTCTLSLMAAALLANTRTRLPNRYASSLLASLCLTAVTRATSAFTIVAAPQKYHRYQLQRNYACVSVGKAKGKSKTSDSVSVSMVKGKLKTTDSGGANARGVMMILSPAKTLDLSPFEAPSPSFPQTSVPNCDAEKTKAVASAMKARSKKDLEKLLGISANLAEKSHQVSISIGFDFLFPGV